MSTPLVCAVPPRLDERVTLGRWTYGLKKSSFKLWSPTERISIGSFCSFAQEALVFGGGEHDLTVTSYPIWGLVIEPGAGHEEARAKGPTVIGSDVLVGTRAMILSGVTVGDGAVVGAGAVVTKDVPPYAVVGGNPARVIRHRFPEAIVERLLEVRWWNWDDETIRRRGGLFADVKAFLAAAESEPPEIAFDPALDWWREGSYDLNILRDSLLGLRCSEPGSAVPRTDWSVERVPLDKVGTRRAGRDWPLQGETMIGERRLDNIRACVQSVLDDKVPGDLIETGAWRGGATIFMRGVLAANGIGDRRVWVADSFDGLPEPDVSNFPADAGSELHRHRYLAVTEAEVRENFARYGLLDRQVHFLAGWFKDTLPTLDRQRFSVVRLDGDLYESTMVALEHLYPLLTPGGYLIVDDYGAIAACRQAVHDYRDRHSIAEPITKIDWTGVYWRKSRPLPRGSVKPRRAAGTHPG